MDATAWTIALTIIIGVPTLYFAWRSYQVSHRSHDLQVEAAQNEKLAMLSMVDPYRQGSVLKFWTRHRGPDSGILYPAGVLINSWLINQGKARALHIDISLSIGDRSGVVTSGSLPTISPNEAEKPIQFVVDEVDHEAPPADPVRVTIGYDDEAGRHEVQWCYRIRHGKDESLTEWTAQQIDCVSERPLWAESGRLGRP